ncbi:hypothetical protein EDC01DRAFT_673549 [Geopyxis carbonaria]|nr:hypothetical protein EDC01DRAFT_673549 [Geopyxis carbonaria]
MAKKDKKTKAAEKRLRVAEKTTRKTAAKQKKTSKKPGKDGIILDADDQDLDAVLEEYARQQAAFEKVTETVLSEPPPVRSGATLTASPAAGGQPELVLFGGETFNGSVATFYNDLHVYNTATGVWRSVTSPNAPLPRSGHGVAATTHGGGTLWVFGGEFSSPKQNTFYHYNDFWAFSVRTREWARVETKGKSPPARSGHRMVGWRGYVVLFGGFQDTAVNTKYLGDLWVFDTASYTWTQVALAAHAQRPDARSSFSLLPHEAGAVLFGGYSKTKIAATAVAGRKGQGGKHTATEVGHIHDDTWLLRLDAADAGKARWERRKKPGNSPNPKRVGVTMAAHKGRGIMFGGVHDRAETDEKLESVFFNDLYAWSTERNRFFPLVLRKPRNAQGAKRVQGGGGRRDRAKEDEAELLANLARLEGKAVEEVKVEEIKEEEAPLSLALPSPRFHCALAVLDDTLYIYGGTVEKDERELMHDEMHAINLDKLDGVRTLFSRRIESEWVDSDSEGEDSGSEYSDDEEDDDDADAESTATDPSKPSAAQLEALRAEKAAAKALAEEAAAAAEDPDPASTTPHPRPFETLRAFYERTGTDWQNLVIAQAELGASAVHRVEKSVKEIRGDAFAAAEEKWWDVREEIRALEDEQEEAGIGEVVSLEAKAGGGGAGAGAAGGAGRRR